MAGGQGGNFINLYNTRAHVFQIDPETKNSWLQKANQAIPVSFVASIVNPGPDSDLSRRELKLIGSDNDGEIILDAIIAPKTQFTKRSQKFGQWIDHRGVVHGLGFNSETELNEFVETFQQLQREILSPITQQQPVTPTNTHNQISSQASDRINWKQQQSLNNASETNGRSSANKTPVDRGMSMNPQQYSNTLSHPGQQSHQMKRQAASNNNSMSGDLIQSNGMSEATAYPRSQSMFGLHSKPLLDAGSTSSSVAAGKVTPDNGNSPLSQSDWQAREQLKYENERLKQALEESSKVASLWNNELVTLRTNNVKLTQALQESKAHVVEWERELLGLRDENKELKMRLSALESGTNSDNNNEYKKDLQKYKNYVDEVQDELRRKEKEVEDLQRSMNELELKSSKQNGHNSANHTIDAKDLQRFDSINAKLEAKISELCNVQKEFAQLVDKLYH